MFFKLHGNTPYMIGDTDYMMTDLSRASVIIDSKKTIYQNINVNGRSPEEVAFDIYGDVNLYWVILFVNNIVNPFIDWYMPSDQFEKYCERIYGDKLMKVKYFKNIVTDEIITGDEVKVFQEMFDSGIQLPEHIAYVTYYDHEKIINENRAMIRVIPKQVVTQFVEEFKKSLKGK